MPSTSPFRTRNSALIIPLSGRPRIEPERDAEGWFVIRGEHAWLFGDRHQALEEHRALVDIERWG
jgi:hypothetical protein